uniref:DUF4515 domain-containing protein n=1 Tax=Trichobilharzia regenti TaxID=157069 RepID=A0AA85IUC3_TRIRE|nr:unnamed protein product [Trichobilharzia regenti]
MATDLNSSSEDDIFQDKEELLKEEYSNSVNEVNILSKELSDMQKELLYIEHLIDEQEIQNNEYTLYIDKKREKQMKNTTTLEDFHLYTLGELKKDREDMLSAYELQNTLIQEKKLLKSFKEELASTADIQLIRQKQEAEIERLEKEIRSTRAQQSEQLKELKAQSIMKQKQLDEETKNIMDQIVKESKKVSDKLIIDYVSNISKENEELYKSILNKLEEIKKLEKQRDDLQKQNEELQRNQIYSKVKTNKKFPIF